MRCSSSASGTLADPARVQQACLGLGRDSGTRFTVILPDGKVVADSDSDPRTMENHADRLEIRAALAALVSLWVSRRISRPLEELRLGIEHYQRGDLRRKLPVPESAEMAALAEALNQMAAQLDARIRS